MAGRKVVKTRIYTINIPSTISIDKLYEKVAGAMKTGYGEAWVEKGKLYVRLTGTDYELKQAWLSIRRAVSELWDLYWLEKTGVASIESIVKEVRATFPPEAVAEALKLRGYRAEYKREEGLLYTNAPASLVLDTARKTAKTLEEIRFRVRGSSAKKVIAALVAGTGIGVDEALEYGLRLGVLGEDEDGRIFLREEWRRAIRKIALVALGGRRNGESRDGEDS